ncbi:MAG: alpha-glucan family phosphorylase, partial [Chloroflexota bacterium]
MPPRLKRLPDLAYNLRWAWDHDTIDLFRRLDHDLWETTMHNPVRLLGSVSQKRLEEVAADSSFVAHLDRVHRRLEKYMGCNNTWYNNAHGKDNVRMAYFCAEYAVTECLPFYSGGLGVLAGDHLKSASDLGLPLVGVGLLYQEGYYRQYINRDGWQGELYPSNDFHNMPVKPELGTDGKPVTIEVAYAGRQVCAQVWRAQVGRVPLFLLNTNIPGNSKEAQDITKRLYPGDMDWRIRQEVMLGIGGLRALRAMGIRPTVCHLNEGHTAFAILERIRLLMQEDGLTFAEAREVAAAGTVFTTHTSVPAGIDIFSPELVEEYLSDYYGCFGLSRQEFLSLGRQNPENDREPLSMAILALKLSSRSNGVSQLHGEVARRMWHNLWPGVPEAEVPIASVTNGVHHPSWISGHDVAPLLVRYLGERWLDDPTDQEVWHGVEHIPDEELWRTHERRRERLVAFARSRLQAQ